MNLKHAKILLVGDYPTPVYTGLLGSYKRAFDYFNVNNQVFYFNLNNKFIRIFKYSDILLQLYSKNYQNELIEFILKIKLYAYYCF
ncbi:MAG: hypothetical protein KatS3mg002_1310 [Candidatus Woesearchaeota archaeon]|nr:MAG: hypothetical protein KatS3mg002_1310 [Candidatus Woesearchaeota archaeon]